MKSPCIQVCVIDPETKTCFGCHRTLSEIAAWGKLSDQDRDDLMAQLEERKRHAKPPAVAQGT